MVQQRKAGGSTSAEASKYLGYGITWAAATALFALLGRWLDGRFGTEPWLTLVGTFVGGAAGFWYMYYHLVIEPQQRDRKGP